MKTLLKFLSAFLVMATMGMTACSSNDDEPKDNQPVDTSYKNVFSQGLPTEVDGATFTTNDKGQVTSIFRGSRMIITFEYGKVSHNERNYDVLMKVLDWYSTSDIYIQTNNQGFAIHALQVYKDEEYEDDTWDFEYNSDGQLSRVKRSEGGDNFKISYTNGDLTKVVQDDADGDHYEQNFKYSDDQFPKGIANKGNIMLFDDIYDVDLDEMELAYFAGLLGKSTNNLPLSNNYSTYNWVLNNNGLPTELNGDSYFSWK